MEIEIQEQEKSFNELLHQLKSELTANEVSVETLLQSLTTLPIYFKREYETAIQKLLPEVEVEGKKTIPELFFRLNPLFTFIDYNLPEYLASEFGSEDLNRKMGSYVERIKIFMKRTTVEELMHAHYWPGDEVCPEHFSRFYAKISDNPKTYTLEKLNHLRRNLCSVLRLSEVLFNLVWIGASSSFIAVWLIPYMVVMKLTESFSNVEKVFFEDNHILMIELNENVIYSSNNTENKVSVPNYYAQKHGLSILSHFMFPFVYGLHYSQLAMVYKKLIRGIPYMVSACLIILALIQDSHAIEFINI